MKENIKNLNQQNNLAQYRHGDVMIEKVDQMPVGKKKLPHTTLALGEVTGHSHRVKEKQSAELYIFSGLLFLRVLSDQATIIHEEHGDIVLPQGDYRVWQQREYTPEEIRTVRD